MIRMLLVCCRGFLEVCEVRMSWLKDYGVIVYLCIVVNRPKLYNYTKLTTF